MTPAVARAALLAFLVTLTWATHASAQETIEYYGTDHLGSVRVVFNVAGSLVSRADYLPYGEVIDVSSGSMPAEQFTGQARDGEAGQDYFHARMYQPRIGRFNAVDPVFNALLQPQKWNRYGYALNSPIMMSDRSGKDPTGGGYSCRQVTPNMGSACVNMPNSAVIVPQGIHGEGSRIGMMSEDLRVAEIEHNIWATGRLWDGNITAREFVKNLTGGGELVNQSGQSVLSKPEDGTQPEAVANGERRSSDAGYYAERPGVFVPISDGIQVTFGPGGAVSVGFTPRVAGHLYTAFQPGNQSSGISVMVVGVVIANSYGKNSYVEIERFWQDLQGQNDRTWDPYFNQIASGGR